MQIERLFETVYILLNKKSVTAKELAEHFEISIRTVYRDIDALSMAGIPIYTNKGRGGGICLMDHYVLNKSLLSNEEQDHILSSLISIQHLANQDVDKVITKLASSFQRESIDWIDVDFTNWTATNDHKFSIIKEAIWNQHILTFTYSNLDGITSHRSVEPLKIIFKGQAWYLFAYCLNKQRPSFFKLNRMQSLELTSKHFERKDIIPEFSEFVNAEKKTVSLKIKIDASHSFLIYDEFISDQIQKDKNGNFLIETQLHDEEWLYSWLMSYGSALTVIAPEHVKLKLIDKIKDNLHNYE